MASQKSTSHPASVDIEENTTPSPYTQETMELRPPATDGLIRTEGVGPREQRPGRLPPRARRSQLAGSDRTQTAASIQRATAVRGQGDQIYRPVYHGAQNHPPSPCLHETIDDHGWVGSKHPLDPPAAQDRAARCPHISGTPQCWGT